MSVCMRLPVVSHPAQQILLGQAGGPQVVLDVVLAPRRPADDHSSDDIDDDDDDDGDDSDMDGCMCAALPYIVVMLPA